MRIFQFCFRVNNLVGESFYWKLFKSNSSVLLGGGHADSWNFFLSKVNLGQKIHFNFRLESTSKYRVHTIASYCKTFEKLFLILQQGTFECTHQLRVKAQRIPIYSFFLHEMHNKVIFKHSENFFLFSFFSVTERELTCYALEALENFLTFFLLQIIFLIKLTFNKFFLSWFFCENTSSLI